jgi:pSer/pThr/pTyr-binding forkhead associated (FHA) protein
MIIIRQRVAFEGRHQEISAFCAYSRKGETGQMRVLILKSAVFPAGCVRLSSADLPVSIGRSRHANIVIEDRLMSRLHAEFRCTPAGEFELADLESTNLAILNQKEVQQAVLRNGDCILLGETELFVEISETEGCSLHERTTRELPAQNDAAE